MTTPRYFDIPFAVSGDMVNIPDSVQGDGSVSYTQGYGVDYSTPVASGGINIERAKMNQLFYDITNALKQYQQNGTPDYYPDITAGAGYAKYSRVRYTNGKTYQSLVNANTDLPTVTASWIEDPLGNLSEFFVGGVTTGSANAQVLASVTPTGFSLATNGATVACTAGFTNTGGANFNISGTGFTVVKKNSGSGLVALTGGEINLNDTIFLTVNTTGACLVLTEGPTLGNIAKLNTDSTNFTNSGTNLAFGSAPALPTGATGVTKPAGNNSLALSTTEYADRAGLKKFNSAPQTISVGGSLTIPHGLGVVPLFVTSSIICQSADGGYSVDDELVTSVTPLYGASGATAEGCFVLVDATNLQVGFTADQPLINVLGKTTRASVTLDVTKWRMVFKAFA